MDLIQLKAEIINLQARLDLKLTEVDVHNKRSDFVQAAQCGQEIMNLANQLHMRKAHLQDMINFHGLIDNLQSRGIKVMAVKRHVEKV